MTKIKVLKALQVQILNDGIEDFNEEDRITEIPAYKCEKCGWMFYGDCVREGYGYDYEMQETPNFCPMCGIKIDFED